MQAAITIAIDGSSSTGKSTLAKALAKKLKYTYIDSGAMYRAITLYFLRNHIDWTAPAEVAEALQNIELAFKFNEHTNASEMLLNEENVEFIIRDLVVAEKVSEIATIKAVREFAVAQQRKMGKGNGIIMDGRDIGTVVFPKAALKLYIVAAPEVRVKRRFDELYERNPNVTLDEIKSNLEMRDYIDSNREISPLKKAKDAVEIDNSDLSFDQFLEKAYKLAKEVLKEKAKENLAK
jgi:CMP/dCMP kinase